MSREICQLEEGHIWFPLKYQLSVGPLPQKKPPGKYSLPETQASS